MPASAARGKDESLPARALVQVPSNSGGDGRCRDVTAHHIMKAASGQSTIAEQRQNQVIDLRGCEAVGDIAAAWIEVTVDTSMVR